MTVSGNNRAGSTRRGHSNDTEVDGPNGHRNCRGTDVVADPGHPGHWHTGLVNWPRTTRIAACVVIAMLSGCGTLQSGPAPASSSTSQSTPTPTPTSVPISIEPSPEATAGTGDALEALGSLAVAGRGPRTGYDRSQFGQSWRDLDRNGCDQRNDVLRRDLRPFVLKVGTHGCLVLTGTLVSPYTGETIHFVRGQSTSNAVQIDHVVALSDAWQKGAAQWSATKREEFANDFLELLAVDGHSNASKGDGDAATWLPPHKAFRCEYIATQIAVKGKYELRVTVAERDAMARVLSGCPGQGLPRDEGSPLGGGPERTASPQTAVPKPVPLAGTPTSYANCTAVRQAGHAPIRRGEPGYAAHLDRDGDGVGCE